MKSFATYGGTKGVLQFAEAVAKEIAIGSNTTRLTSKQARAALAIFDARDQDMFSIIVTTDDAPESLAPRLTSDRRAPLPGRLREMTQPTAFKP